MLYTFFFVRTRFIRARACFLTRSISFAYLLSRLMEVDEPTAMTRESYGMGTVCVSLDDDHFQHV